MGRDSKQHANSGNETDDLRLTRRAAMALLGVGAVAGAGSGAGAARDDRTGTAARSSGAADAPERKWNQHIDAQLHDLRNLRDLDAKSVRTNSLYSSARDAEALVWRDESGIYRADSREETIARSQDFTEVVQAAIDSLDDDRTDKQKVVVACSGTMGPHEGDGDVLAIEVPSYTILDLRGTIYVEDEGEALIRPLRARDVVEIEIPRVKIVGNFRSAIWFKGVRRVTFGHIDIRTPEGSVIEGTGGAVRIDGGRNIFEKTINSQDIQIDSCYFENTQGHAFETYNVDRIQIGRVIAKDTVEGCGVLLNETTDATVDAVVGRNIDPGGGYAAFRVANGAHDVTCGQVVARGGARGVFGVSNCREITIGQVNIQETEANGVLIQDCQNFSIQGGVVKNCEGDAIRVDSRSSPDHPAAEGVSITNVRVVDNQDEKTQTYGIHETGPGTANNRFVDNDLRDAGTEANMTLFAPSTVVRDNLAGGVAHGTATLTAGESPAATVEGVTENGNVTLDLRAKPREAPGSAFGYDHHFEWDGGQWNLRFEWTTDPGEDVDVDYIVDRPQANIGLVEPGEDDEEDDGDENQGEFPFETSTGVVESFESGNIDGYSGATDQYEVNSDAPVADGDNRLEGFGGEGTQIVTTDLDRSPAPGTTFSAKMGWTDDAQNSCIAFGANETTDPAEDDSFPFHFVRLWASDGDTSDFRFQFYDRTGAQLVGNTIGETDSNAFYEVVVDWAEDGSMTITLNDPDGNELANHELSEVGGGTDWGDGGIGTRGTGLLDDVRIVENRRE